MTPWPGAPDFEAIYAGYASAVDWPTAAFWRELAAAGPRLARDGDARRHRSQAERLFAN
jgi:hypothetical protein